MPSHRRLQQFAIAISIASVVYNGIEGGLSIGFGVESGSRALIFFGIQSGIEVISAGLVLHRFRKIAKPGDESSLVLNAEALRFEKLSTLGIGLLLLALAVATESNALATLVLREVPNSSTPSLIIAASALVLMILIWLPKRFLAKALNSSAMQSEATCSLSCIQITLVLFFGSLLFKVWKGGWWVNGTTCIVLGLLFAWEGWKMVRWARSDKFTGGCCEVCHGHPAPIQDERPKPGDVCGKESCQNSDECKQVMHSVNVSGIAPVTTRDHLGDFFNFCGKIVSIDFNETSEPKSAVIHFEKPSAAKTALMLNGGTLDGIPLRVTSDTAHQDEEKEDGAPIDQSDKPRAGIAAEYLAKGYILQDHILQRAIDIDNKQGISKRFLDYFHSLDTSLGARALGPDQTISGKVQSQITAATQQAKDIDEQRGYSKTANDYYTKALCSPLGNQVLAFWTSTSKQVLDIHEEARRIATAHKAASSTNDSASNTQEPA